MHDITVRRMQFEFPDGIDPLIIDGEPEESFWLLGLSLLLPYLEPYLIRTMNEAKKRIGDPDLLKDLERFNAQEGQHYRQHRRFNEAVRMAGFPKLAELEAELDTDYRRFSEERSLKFNLAYAEGFEALTTATARYAFETNQLERCHPAARELFGWHLVEELEHRTVAFEVYDHIFGDYFYRLRWGLYAQRHMFSWIKRVAEHLEQASQEVMERCGGQAGCRSRMRAHARRAVSGLLPKVMATYLPWYTPEKIAFPAELRPYAEAFSRAAISTSR